MNEVVIILCTLAITFSILAMLFSCIAISVVVGLKNSTHTIQWKPLETPKDLDIPDPMADFSEPEEIPTENPFKRKKKIVKEVKEDFEFMEEVTDQSNF